MAGLILKVAKDVRDGGGLIHKHFVFFCIYVFLSSNGPNLSSSMGDGLKHFGVIWAKDNGIWEAIYRSDLCRLAAVTTYTTNNNRLSATEN